MLTPSLALIECARQITRSDYGVVLGDSPWPASTAAIDRRKQLQRWHQEAFLAWWDGGEAKTRSMFDNRYLSWSKAIADVENKDALYRQCRALLARDRNGKAPLTGAKKAAYLRLKGMGITALPMFLERIANGEHELIPIVVAVTDNAPKLNESLPLKEQAKHLRKWWAANKQDWLIPWPTKKTK